MSWKSCARTRNLNAADKDAILFGNSQRFYQLTLS